jgi:hypothetical protein
MCGCDVLEDRGRVRSGRAGAGGSGLNHRSGYTALDRPRPRCVTQAWPVVFSSQVGQRAVQHLDDTEVALLNSKTPEANGLQYRSHGWALDVHRGHIAMATLVTDVRGHDLARQGLGGETPEPQSSCHLPGTALRFGGQEASLSHASHRGSSRTSCTNESALWDVPGRHGLVPGVQTRAGRSISSLRYRDSVGQNIAARAAITNTYQQYAGRLGRHEVAPIGAEVSARHQLDGHEHRDGLHQ